MIGWWRGILAAALATFLTGGLAQQPVKPQPLKSGLDFTGPEVRELQHDDFANPGMLWIARGEALWQEAAGRDGKSCAACHGDAKTAMKGVAARYPRIDEGSARLINIEGRIQQCRERRQQAEPFKYESAEMLALTAYVAQQSRGMPMNVTIDWQNRHNFEAGRAMYYRRTGQMNLSCAQCHQDNWGKKLGPETMSQGHGVAYPIYRLEWQSLGSLQRRLRNCISGMRAEVPDYGAPEYVNLELFLMQRASGMPMESPAVRP